MLEVLLYRKSSFVYVQVSDKMFSEVGLNQTSILKDHYYISEDRIHYREIHLREYIRELVMFFLSKGEDLIFCSGRYTLLTTPAQYKYDHFLGLELKQIPAEKRYQILEKIIAAYLSVSIPKEIVDENSVWPVLTIQVGGGNLSSQIQGGVYRQISS